MNWIVEMCLLGGVWVVEGNGMKCNSVGRVTNGLLG